MGIFVWAFENSKVIFLPNTWNIVDGQPNVFTDKSYPKETRNFPLYNIFYGSCSVMFGRYSWI